MKQKPTWSAKVSCEGAQWFARKLPTFVASETDAAGVVQVASKWVGGKKQPIHFAQSHPVHVRQGVC